MTPPTEPGQGNEGESRNIPPTESHLEDTGQLAHGMGAPPGTFHGNDDNTSSSATIGDRTYNQLTLPTTNYI